VAITTVSLTEQQLRKADDMKDFFSKKEGRKFSRSGIVGAAIDKLYEQCGQKAGSIGWESESQR
jgi:hypothetical protein